MTALRDFHAKQPASYALALPPKPENYYQALDHLLRDPSAKRFPFAVHEKPMSQLLEELAPLLPASAAARFRLLSHLYGEEFAMRVDVNGSASVFSFVLAQKLAKRDLLAKQENGEFTLVKGLKEFHRRNQTAGAPPMPKSPQLQAEVEGLLALPQASAFPVFIGDAKIERLAKIIEERAPQDPESRKLWVASALDPRSVSRLELEGSPDIFAYHLITALSQRGELGAKNGRPNYPLVQMLFP